MPTTNWCVAYSRRSCSSHTKHLFLILSKSGPALPRALDFFFIFLKGAFNVGVFVIVTIHHQMRYEPWTFRLVVRRSTSWAAVTVLIWVDCLFDNKALNKKKKLLNCRKGNLVQAWIYFSFSGISPFDLICLNKKDSLVLLLLLTRSIVNSSYMLWK